MAIRTDSTRWYTNAHGCVGISCVTDLITMQPKIYISNTSGEDEQADTNTIKDYGGELTKDDLLWLLKHIS